MLSSMPRHRDVPYRDEASDGTQAPGPSPPEPARVRDGH